MKKHCENCIYETLPNNPVTFSSQQSIFMEGEKAEYVFRIKEGYVKMSRIHPNGEEKIFDILGPGDYIALLAVLKGEEEYVASAEAITSVKAIRILTSEVNKAYNSNNIFKASCLNCAVTRGIMFQEKLFISSSNDLESKILNALHLLSNKFGITSENTIKLNLPFTKTQLASIIGIRRETLSRKLSEMSKNKVIQIQKNTYIFNRL